MKKIIAQYAAMMLSLLAMLWSIAYLRQSGDVVYLADIGVFLMLLAWSSPFESAFGNVLFKIARDNTQHLNLLLTGRQNIGFLWKAALVGLGLAIAFLILSWSYGNSALLAALVGVVFFLRIQEFIMKNRLVFKEYGQEGQILINLGTFLKWSGAALAMLAGLASFTAFGLVNIVVSLGVLALMAIIFRRRKSLSVPATVPVAAAGWRDEFISLTGVGCGVVAFQIDKILAAFRAPPEAFGEYVVIYTMAMLGPYILNPVFVLGTQRLVSAIRAPDRTREDLSALVEALVRFSALAVGLMLPVALALVMIWFSQPFEQDVLINFALLAAASYTSCRAHGFYIAYLANGDLRRVLMQNLIALIAAACIAGVVVAGQSDLYGLIVLAAALGQLAWPLYERFRHGEAVTGAGSLLVVPGLAAYLATLVSLGSNWQGLLLLGLAGLLLIGLEFLAQARRLQLSAVDFARGLLHLTQQNAFLADVPIR